jgi:hypothetical protein
MQKKRIQVSRTIFTPDDDDRFSCRFSFEMRTNGYIVVVSMHFDLMLEMIGCTRPVETPSFALGIANATE